MVHILIKVQAEDFQLSDEYEQLREYAQGSGAIVQFIGLVRDLSVEGKLSGLALEHYPGMTEKVISEIVANATERWHLSAVRVIHRIGELANNDQIVFVGVASQHREEAFRGAEFIMDFLKSKAPFWKRERSAAGTYQWVDAKESDQRALDRWRLRANTAGTSE